MEMHESHGMGFCLSGCSVVTDAVLWCPIHGRGVGARGEGLCHPHSSIVEEEELQKQLPRGVPACGLGSLASLCVFVFHLLILTFYLCFLTLGGELG